jgi:hypothetical protein
VTILIGRLVVLFKHAFLLGWQESRKAYV